MFFQQYNLSIRYGPYTKAVSIILNIFQGLWTLLNKNQEEITLIWHWGFYLTLNET